MIELLMSQGVGFSDIVIYIISCLVVIFLTLPIHEFAHGFAAVKLGDNTPRWQGRLTLNPFAHIDYIGSLFILLFGFGWAKPVQVNQRNFRNPKVDMAITAFAGPISNLIMAFLAAFLYCLVWFLCFEFNFFSNIILYVTGFLSFVAQINVSLAVFNLIPIPPLDGSRLLAVLLPDRYYYKLMQYEQYFFIVIIVLMSSGAASGVLHDVTSNILSGLYHIAGMPFNLF